MGWVLAVDMWTKGGWRMVQKYDNEQSARAVRGIWSQSDALRMGMGWTEEDLEKPYVLIEDVFGESHPGSIHLDQLAKEVAYGVLESGGRPSNFHVTDLCDGIAQGHDGMNYILLSRQLIADMVEVHASVHPWDGLVLISSCDKAVPAHLIAAGRLGLPTIVVPGGTMRPGPFMSDSGRAGEISLKYKQHEIGDFEVMQYKKTGCPSCGACQFLGTANTMQAMAEALGLALPGSSLAAATMIDITQMARQAGQMVLRLKAQGITADDILTPEAFENAIIIHAAIGGSTNAMIHLPAIAQARGIKLDVRKFDEINRLIPHLCDIAPSGRYPAETLWLAGGIPAVQEALKDLLHLDVMTVTGRTLGENLEQMKQSGFYERNHGFLANYGLRPDDIIRPRATCQEFGTVAVLSGNLAPEGAVIKYSAVRPDMMYHVGKARIFDCEEDCQAAVVANTIDPGDVMIIRYEGPRGSGMPEMYMTTEAIMNNPRLNTSTVLITDGRYSGATKGPCVGHVSPEAAAGGPIALLEAGDLVELDIPGRQLRIVGIAGVHREEAAIADELARRKAAWVKPDHSGRRGIFKRFTETATSGMDGAYMP